MELTANKTQSKCLFEKIDSNRNFQGVNSENMIKAKYS